MRKSVLKVAALVMLACAAIAAVVLWRDPYLLIRGEFARQRIAAGLSRASVEAAGHRWAYAYRDADAADAPTLVMVHGFTGSKENWYPLARALGGRYRLLIPDLPGWARANASRTRCTASVSRPRTSMPSSARCRRICR